MFWPFNRKSQREKDRELMLSIILSVSDERQKDRELLEKAITVLRDGTLANAEALRAFADWQIKTLDTFKTPQQPEGWINNDMNEYLREQEQLGEMAKVLSNPGSLLFEMD